MIKYVLGFLFDEQRRAVALTVKNHPEWQAGKLNGIGGHVGDEEDFTVAMHRECKEELNVEADWEIFARMTAPAWTCWCFRAFLAVGDFNNTNRVNDAGERIVLVPVHAVIEHPRDFISNLSWLIPLALDQGTPTHPFRQSKPGRVEVWYND
jgi:8-oxo-dGTP diphosphatase